MKYHLIDTLGVPRFCGPPVVRFPPPDEVHREVTALRSQDPRTFDAILSHQHLDANHLTTENERLILDQVAVLQALSLQSSDGRYRFDYIAFNAAAQTTKHVAGTIDESGAISLDRADPTTFPGYGGCPICLSAADRIDTPAGPVPVTELRAGMIVWTLDPTGRRIAAPVVRVSHVPAPPGHRVVRLALADGRLVQASQGHPTTDARTVGQLRPGDLLDGSRVMSADLIPYVGDTWDLLPAGPTGVYWANGIPLRSTVAGS